MSPSTDYTSIITQQHLYGSLRVHRCESFFQEFQSEKIANDFILNLEPQTKYPSREQIPQEYIQMLYLSTRKLRNNET
jgi:hypothetical protein